MTLVNMRYHNIRFLIKTLLSNEKNRVIQNNRNKDGLQQFQQKIFFQKFLQIALADYIVNTLRTTNETKLQIQSTKTPLCCATCRTAAFQHQLLKKQFVRKVFWGGRQEILLLMNNHVSYFGHCTNISVVFYGVNITYLLIDFLGNILGKKT